MLLVHNEIHYVPIGDGWEEVLVCNVLHYVPLLHYVPIPGPTPFNAPRNDVAPLKIIMYRAIKTTGTLIVIVLSGSELELLLKIQYKIKKNLK